jgi:hypothetical protein
MIEERKSERSRRSSSGSRSSSSAAAESSPKLSVIESHTRENDRRR